MQIVFRDRWADLKVGPYVGTALVLVALAAFAAPAEAQRAAGPFAGVLGAATDADATHSLDLRGSLFGAWDDTLSRTEAGAPVDERFLRSGSAFGASGSLTHMRRTTRTLWESSAASALRSYGTTSDASAATFSGSTGVRASVSRRVALLANGGFTYSPYYDFAPGLDGRLSNVGAFGGGFSMATAAERNVAMSGGAGMNVRISRRDTFDVTGSARRFDFLEQNENSVDSWELAAQFSHQLARTFGFHAGVGRSEAKYRLADRATATSDNIDIGVDYGDTLRFSRRTSFSFGSSTSAIRWNNGTHYRVNGTAALTHGFGRSGSAALRYERGTEFTAGFREPLLRDSVTGGFNHQLGRRASWSSQAGYMRGNVGFGSDASHFDAYNAGAGVNIAVSRRFGVFTDYSFYRYDVPAGATVFTSLQKFSRQSVTAGLTLWVPLISERSSRDPR